MAEGWAKHLYPRFFNTYSAGIETHGLNPNAVKVMAEENIDISKQKSQNINEFKNTPLDYIITVCDHAYETCPTFQKKCQIIHISFPDPPKLAKELAEKGATPEQQLNCYRQVRDQIKNYIKTLHKSFIPISNGSAAPF